MIRESAISRIVTFLTHPYLTVATRLALGGLWIFAGVVKLYHVDDLIWEINKYQILPSGLATVYGHVLPPLEVALGVLLVVGLFLRVSASVSGLLVMSFVIAKITALARGLNITICGCLGPAVPLLAVHSLIIDFVLLALVVQILLHRGEFLALGPWLSQKAAELEQDVE